MGRPAVLKIDILADAKGVGKGVAEADGALGKLGSGARKAGLAVGAGLAIGAVAVGGFAIAAVQSASAVEQSYGAVESVFGKAAAQVQGYASTAATQLGLAKSEYAGLAAVVGSQLQSMGVEQTASAAKTDELIRMGADLAATFGGSVSDAVGAVGSLLRGERDPIERYGVAIKAADVEARLAAQGQSELEGAARKSAEAQATLALLTEATTNAHGAFGRESNTLAGQQERLRAQFENVKATVGAGLTPALTGLLTFVNGTALPGLQRLGGDLADRLRPAFQAVSAFVTGTVVPALARLAAENDGKVRPAFQAVSSFVTANVLPVLQGVGRFVVDTLVPALSNLASKALKGLQEAFQIVSGKIKENKTELDTIGRAIGTVAGVVGPLASLFGETLAFGMSVAGNAIGAVVSALGAIVRAAEAAGRAIANVVNAGAKVGGIVGKLNPFGGPPLVGMGPQLVGAGPQLVGPAGLSRAALGSGGTLSLLAAGGVGGGRTTIDNSVRVTIDGALDPVGTARALERVLADHARRVGRLSTLAGAL